MPRTGRLHITGGCYHVMGRGLERRFIAQSLEHENRVSSGNTRTGSVLYFIA